MDNKNDQLPPHDEDAEAAALGCCLIDASLISELSWPMFYAERHKVIYQMIADIVGCGNEVNGMILVAQLSDARKISYAGGAEYVLSLETKCGGVSAFAYWRNRLSDFMERRAGLSATNSFFSALRDPNRNPGEAIAEAREQMDRIENARQDVGHTIRERVNAYIDALEAAQGQPRQIGLQTGFHGIDRIAGGLRDGSLNIIGARPGNGKTSLALNIAANVALVQKLPVAVFSLEMTNNELVHRLLCSQARVASRDLETNHLDDDQRFKLQCAAKTLAESKLFLYDEPGLTLSKLGTEVRRLKKAHGIRFVVVDYLGLLRSGVKTGGRYEEVTELSGGLKRLALSTKLPFLVPAQLNRAPESGDREPGLSDLRDSGSIEQDADLAALLFHDGPVRETTKSVLRIGKNRHGPIGRVNLMFHGPTFTFTDEPL